MSPIRSHSENAVLVHNTAQTIFNLKAGRAPKFMVLRPIAASAVARPATMRFFMSAASLSVLFASLALTPAAEEVPGPAGTCRTGAVRPSSTCWTGMGFLYMITASRIQLSAVASVQGGNRSAWHSKSVTYWGKGDGPFARLRNGGGEVESRFGAADAAAGGATDVALGLDDEIELDGVLEAY